MSQSVQAMEEEGERKEGLESRLDSRRPSCNRCDHGLRLEVPSRVRRDEVGDAEEVERAGQGNTSDAVERRGDPGDLRLVDGQVGGDGAVDALLCEDLGSLRLRGMLSCCESGVSSLVWLLLLWQKRACCRYCYYGYDIPPLHHTPRGLHLQTRRSRPSQTELEYALRSHDVGSPVCSRQCLACRRLTVVVVVVDVVLVKHPLTLLLHKSPNLPDSRGPPCIQSAPPHYTA